MSMSLEAVNVLELPSLPLSQNKKLPTIGAVYFFIVDGKIQYIGQSSKLRQRLRCHEVRSEIDNFDECNIAWLEMSDSAERLVTESWFKEQFHPPLQSVWKKHQKTNLYDLADLGEQDYYTTGQAAALLGDITGQRVLQIAKSSLIEGVDYRIFGRVMAITPQGLTSMRNRNTKPGPQTSSGRKAA